MRVGELIDAAYHDKYDRYGPRIVGAVTGPCTSTSASVKVTSRSTPPVRMSPLPLVVPRWLSGPYADRT
ncbi:MAG TPA: hypothetical protein VFS29_04875 [Motilibacteraceae bacterium]|nr:hypothetical protein [Motilibacteraceae bacterium]